MRKMESGTVKREQGVSSRDDGREIHREQGENMKEE